MSEITIALVGNPNTGKTTLFNTIANAEEHVGNWHGVTVEYKEKKLKRKDGSNIILTDLPGTYSLSCYSFEEAVTREYLLKHKNIKIINICDANNLLRNLLLTTELIEMGYSPIVCINMANEIKKSGLKIDINILEKMLGLKVFLINAQNKKEVKNIIDYIAVNDNMYQNKNLSYFSEIINFFKSNKLEEMIDKKLDLYEVIKVLEQDEYCLNELQPKIKNFKALVDILNAKKTVEFVLETKYNYLDNVIKKAVVLSKKNKIYGYNKLDRFVLNKYLSLPIFFVIIAVIFFLTFGNFGTFLSNVLSNVFENLIFDPLTNFINKSTSNIFVINFITQALFGSILSLVSFLPQIMMMFLGLYILEDSGYMSRLAFSLEDYFKKIGLSGKSVFTLLMGFGCGTTASLTSRNMEDKNSKIKTAMLTPYVSCSAKLPLYAVVCGAFFPNIKFFVVFCLYLLGILTAILVSYFLNKTLLPSGAQSFIMELPPYRLPSLKKVFKNIYINVKQFLLRVGTILLTFSCIVWLIENCNFKLEYQSGESILEAISKFIAPLFTPLGFGSYGVVACLLCGFVAKEIIVSTIGLLNGCFGNSKISDISNSIILTTSAFTLTTASGLSFLVFALLYLPCVSTVSVFVKEIGVRWTLFACLLEFAISYALSFVVYKIALYFCINGAISGMMSLAVFLFLVVVILAFVNIFKHKKQCNYCHLKGGCKKGNNK